VPVKAPASRALVSNRPGPRIWQHLGPTSLTPFQPFPVQHDFYDKVRLPWPGVGQRSKKPYPRVFGGCCGRRWGKTTIGEKLIWKGLMAPQDRKGAPTVRLTADTEEHALKIWREFIAHLEQTDLSGLLKDHSKEFNRVELIGGATAQMYSANNPAALSGDGVTLWIIDEAQFLSQAAWVNLFPSISDRSGVIVMLGVAQGEGPFREICYMGDNDLQPEFAHLTFPTASNPYISQWDIEFAQRTLTAKEFQQLYLAQWVSGLGKIFWNIHGCIVPDQVHIHPKDYAFTRPPIRGNQYYGGLDLARLEDWCVYSIWDNTGRLTAWDRFHGMSWDAQYARCAAFSAAYGHPLTVVDSTGLGDPVYEALINRGMNVMEYKISGNDKKRQLIDKLAIRIGQEQMRYPNIPDFLRELDRMESTRKEGSSIIQYSAPVGATDDFVVSAALACQVIPEPPMYTIDAAYEVLEENALVQHDVSEYI
jgi:hypothetical protein